MIRPSPIAVERPEMKTLCLWLVLACVHAPAFAAEIDEQIPPRTPRIQATSQWVVDSTITNDGADMLIAYEVSTMGRVGDFGYLWEVWLPNGKTRKYYWTRRIFNCVTQQGYTDWMAITDAGPRVIGESPGARSWGKIAGNNARIAFKAACSGQPPSIGPTMSWREAIAFAAASPDR